ncbi:MAG: hypothetical protein ACT4NL_07065 [Pseudomarimonas sp.]
MKMKLVALALTLAVSAAAQGNVMVQSDAATLAERADERAATITDAEKFVEEIDQSLVLAMAGDYGRMKRGDITRMNKARDVIAELLEGHSNALELKPEERIELYNAQEVLTATIRNDEKDRKVCKLEAVTGSRLGKTECMTVAEREERARRARSGLEDQIRTVCLPGEGKSC